MTKVSRKMVRCSKCGKESEQLLVFSVNFMLGTKEDNENLMAHQQKCPYCGYEASDISINNDNSLDKYNIDAEDNVPQFVYGIPDFFREQEKNNPNREVFSAFEGGYSGPSHYFFINKNVDKYEFKYGFSDSGIQIFNYDDDDKMTINLYDKDYYDSFIKEMKGITNNWDTNYNNSDILDGTQWDINYIEDEKIYSGSNDFPESYNQMKDVIKKYFKVFLPNVNYDKYVIEPENNIPQEVYGIPDSTIEKYDINPENNIPQRVYGVPNSFKVPDESNIPSTPSETSGDKKAKIKISRNNNEYVMAFSIFNGTSANLTFADMKNLGEKSISDISTQIPMKYYSKFMDKLISITKDWNKAYDGLENINWIVQIEENGNIKKYNGSGSYPNNWNEFMDLLIEYEVLFKQKKEQDIITIKNMNESAMTLEELVKKQFEDPFWAEVVIKYFKEQLKANETVSKIVFSDIKKYKDILSEFAKCLVQKTYDLPDALVINGYTAKMISELNPSFEVSGVYSFMTTLRDKKDYALKIIKEGFPNKDAVPPTLNNNVDNKLKDEQSKVNDNIETNKEQTEIYKTCISDNIGKIEFCKSFSDNIIKVKNEKLKTITKDNFSLDTEITIDLNYIGKDLEYVLNNINIYVKTAEKIYEMKDEILDKLPSQALDYVYQWWETNLDEKDEIIDIEYIQKCLSSCGLSILIGSSDDKITFDMTISIYGNNEEDFLLSHYLEALVSSENENYKIKFDIA